MFDPSGVMRYMGEASVRGCREGASAEPSEYLVSALGAVPLYALRRLIETPGSTVEAAMDHMVSHVEVADPMADLSQVCSYLSMAGYLRAEYTGHQIGGMPVYRFSIPNGEVRESLSKLVSEAGESAVGRDLVRQSVGSSSDPDGVGNRPLTGNR